MALITFGSTKRDASSDPGERKLLERVVPWQQLCALIEPVYPKPGRGRLPVGLERMLRICFLQLWFNLSDLGVEEALYHSLRCGSLPVSISAVSRCRTRPRFAEFRHLLEQHELGTEIFATVNEHLESLGLKVGTGTIVDATIISAPSSTKNATKQRDPEMHQTRKGQQWYFGMKAHVGVDSRTRLIHSAVATAANVHDASVLGDLLHGEERRVWGDQAYRGQRHVIREHAPSAQDFTNRRYRHRGVVDEAEKARNRTKSKIRAKVEHSIGVELPPLNRTRGWLGLASNELTR